VNAAEEPAACAVSQHYPLEITQWCALITKYAQKNGLPPDLIAGLVWQESGGNPSAYSHSGAVGLMQVMPRDGLAAGFMCKNGPCFANRPSSSELSDPEFNIKYGTKMLAGLLNRYGGYREALRAYGPMDVGYSYADKVLRIYERHRN
jgi:soluble lytic murein transglycosylase-like protein